MYTQLQHFLDDCDTDSKKPATMKKLLILLLFPLFAFSQDCFLPADNSDPNANFKALCDCIETTGSVTVTDFYEVYADRTFFTNKDIVIKGIGKEKSGLIFLNKNFTYFDSSREDVIVDGVIVGKASGLNMSFESLSLTTGEYEAYKNDKDYLSKVSYKNDYYLQRVKSANSIVDVDYLKINNCFIGGSLKIMLSGDHPEVNGYGVKLLEIVDNQMDYPMILASISAYPKLGYVNRNNIRNLRGSLVTFKKSGSLYLNDNVIENDVIIQPGHAEPQGYVTLALCSEGTERLEGHRNRFKNILNTAGSETYPVYPVVDNFVWEDNEVTNVFQISPIAEICLMKFKGVKSVKFNRNRHTITREAYVKTGLLKSMDAPIESVHPDYYTCIISASKSFTKEFSTEIRNNVFSIPTINQPTHLMNADNFIEDNIFNIEYFSQSQKASSYHREKLLFKMEGDERGVLLFNRNIVNANKAKDNEFSVIGMIKAPHRIIENCDNNYYFTEPIKLSFGRISHGGEVASDGHQSHTYKAVNNFINKGSIEDVTGIAFETVDYPYTQTGFAQYTIGESIGNTEQSHIANIDSFGKTTVEVLQNHSDTFGVFRFLYSNFRLKSENPYFDKNQVDILIHFNGTTVAGTDESVTYKLSVAGRKALIYSGVKSEIFNTKETFTKHVANIQGKASQVNLAHRNFTAGDASYLVLENLSKYRSFTVSVMVLKN